MHRLLRLLRADSVSARLLVAFVLVSIAPVVVAGVLVYRAVETTLREELWQRLGTVTQLNTQQIDAWLFEKRQDVVRPAGYPQFRRAVAELVVTPHPAASLVADVREALEQSRVAGGFVEMFLVRVSDGAVVASTDPTQEGTIQRDRPYFLEAQTKPFVQP